MTDFKNKNNQLTENKFMDNDTDRTVLVNLQNEFALLKADNEALKHQLAQDALKFENEWKQQVESHEQTISQIKLELNSKIEQISKQYDVAIKDKESMVMKFAVSENCVINLRKQVKQLENKLKDCAKDQENWDVKFKKLTGEKTKLFQQLEAKENEILLLSAEIQKKKDELFSQSSNLKYFQNKLKLEQDAHADTRIKLDKMVQLFKETKDQTELAQKEVKTLLEKNAEYESIFKETEQWRKEHMELINANRMCQEQYNKLENTNKQLIEDINKLQRIETSYNQAIADLQAKMLELEATQLLLFKEREIVALLRKEVEQTGKLSSELENDMVLCRKRETEMLDFTRQLTEKNVALQTEFSSLEARYQQSQIDLADCKALIDFLTSEKHRMDELLKSETQHRIDKCNELTEALDEQTKRVNDLTQKLDDQVGENQLLRKKHQASVKELSRELNAFRKKGLKIEEETVSLGSSNSSLDGGGGNITEEMALPDRHVLVEKIVAMQRTHARTNEKLEFLEEHAQQLLDELQKKTRVIQTLVMQHSTGLSTLTSNSVDNHKSDKLDSARKAAFAKRGGIMASVYNSKPVDETMTLDLSLEMNRKLQAVLEDTLLKNITLKENIETLGNEIARLSARSS